MNQISMGGWIAIVVVITLTISINAWLIALWRGKKIFTSFDILKKGGETLKAPWGKEDHQLSELSRLVSDLKSKTDQSKEPPSS